MKEIEEIKGGNNIFAYIKIYNLRHTQTGIWVYSCHDKQENKTNSLFSRSSPCNGGR